MFFINLDFIKKEFFSIFLIFLIIIFLCLFILFFLNLKNKKVFQIKLINSLKNYLNKRLFIDCSILSFFIWLGTILQFWFAFDAVLTDFSVWAVLLTLSAAYLSIIITFTPGNFGTYHAIFITVLLNFDIPETYSFTIAVLIHSLNFILCLFFGLISYYFIYIYEFKFKKK